MTYTSEVLADTPLAYWKLGEPSGTTAADSAVAGVHGGTYVSTPTLGVTGAISGNTAVTFDGASEYVTTTTLGALGSSLASASFEFWVKTSSTAQGCVIGANNSGSTTLVFMLLNTDGAGVVTPGKTRFAIRNNAGLVTNVESSFNVYDNQWHHMVFVVRDLAVGSFGVFVDGFERSPSSVFQSPGTWPGAFSNFTVPMTIAARNNNATIQTFAAASVDDVAVYTTNLSAARVRAHYEASARVVVPANGMAGASTKTFVQHRTQGRIQARRAAYDPTSALLTWKPRDFPTYAGYTTVHISNSLNAPTLNANTDYLVICDSPITTTEVLLDGGRNLVLIGGECDSRTRAAGRTSSAMVPLKIYNQTGHVHIEGWWFRGTAPDPQTCTAVATTDVVTTGATHNFTTGQQVAIPSKTGGTGVTLSQPYFVRNPTGTTLQLSLTSGGALLDITSDLSAGRIHRASGALGDALNFNNITNTFSEPTNTKAVTGLASTDVFTSTAHGFVNGERAQFNSLTGGTGVNTTDSYFVTDATANTFKLLAFTSTITRRHPPVGTYVNLTTDLTAGTVRRGTTALSRATITMQNCRVDWTRGDSKAQQDGTTPYNNDPFDNTHPDVVQWFGGAVGTVFRVDKLQGTTLYQGLFTQAAFGDGMDFRRVFIDGSNTYDGVTQCSGGLFYNSVDTWTDWPCFAQDCYALSSKARSLVVIPDQSYWGFTGVTSGSPATEPVPAAGGAGEPGMSYTSPGYRW